MQMQALFDTVTQRIIRELENVLFRGLSYGKI